MIALKPHPRHRHAPLKTELQNILNNIDPNLTPELFRQKYLLGYNRVRFENSLHAEHPHSLKRKGLQSLDKVKLKLNS